MSLQTSTDINVTLKRTIDGLDVTLTSKWGHATTFRAIGQGTGEFETAGGIMQIDTWRSFLGTKLSVEVSAVDGKWKIIFKKGGADVALFQGYSQKSVNFLGKGEAVWQD